MQECLFLQEHISTKGYVVILGESFRSSFPSIQSFLSTFAEPTSRPSLIHEYHITPFSLGTAVSAGVTTSEVIKFLDAYVYGFCDKESAALRSRVCTFTDTCMSRYNLARVIVDGQRTLVECEDVATAETLLRDRVIRSLSLEPLEVQPSSKPFFLLRSRAVVKIVAERCVLLGFPLQQEYEYEKDINLRGVNIALRAQTKPRDYQIDAVDAAASGGLLRSGCIVLPCGAGKTLVGIMLLCRVRKPTLILCAGSVSVEQWKNQILEFSSLCAPDEFSSVARNKSAPEGAARIACLTGKQKDDITDDTDIVLTTYHMLVSSRRAHVRRRTESGAERTNASDTAEREGRPRRQRADPKERLFQPYGLLLMDEVHVMPAEAYKESLSLVDAKAIIGLTATYVREDAKIRDLFHLVGPKIYDISWEALASRGFLANVTCIEVHTPLTRQFSLEYMERSSDERLQHRKMPLLVLLAAANPNKIICVDELVRRHVAESSKVLVFCDHLMLLKEYGKHLRAPVICGETPHRERLMIFSDFQSTSKINVICISRVGDVSVNLPSANVVIQVSSHGGSRRQEAQRLGRILRPKARASNGKSVDAWFYTIISTDTLEMAYAAHRTAFLVDQGYMCRIMEFLPDTLTTDETTAVSASTTRAEEGDVVSMKQERLRRVFRDSKLLRQSDKNTDGAANARCIDYQLELLARIVSSWEFEYHGQMKEQQNMNPVENSESDDDVVVVNHVKKDAGAIKREWMRESITGRCDDQPTPGCRGNNTTSLQCLVGVSENFVYHEL